MKEDQAQTEATFRFVVNQISKLKKSVLSSPCYIGNISWTIMVEPPKNDTQDETTGRSLGVFLRCSSASSSWACYAMAEYRLLSIRPGVPPITKKTQHLFSSEGSRSWGYPSFMPWTDVLDMKNGYIKDDSITLEVHIVEGDGIVKQLSNLEEELDEERKERTVAVAAHKKLKGDLKEAETQVEFLYKVIKDTLNQLKKSEPCKEPTRDGEEARAVVDKVVASNIDEKRKKSALEAELLQLTQDLSSSERVRRAFEAERVELQDEISNGNKKASLLENEKRRLEAIIATLEKELEDEQSANEVLADKFKKTQLLNLLLECQNKKLKATLSEQETSHRTETKATIEQLEAEAKERLALKKQSRKLDKKLKEIEVQLEDEIRKVDQYQEQVEKMNDRVKAVNCQLEEAKEENIREKAEKRKVQRELEDMVESQKSMAGEISILKSIIRRNAGDMDLTSSSATSKCGSPKREGNGSGDDGMTQDHAKEGDDITT